MTTSDKTPKHPPEPAEPITEFEVSDGGTLRMANFSEAEPRAGFCEYVAGFWSGSPKGSGRPVPPEPWAMIDPDEG